VAGPGRASHDVCADRSHLQSRPNAVQTFTQQLLREEYGRLDKQSDSPRPDGSSTYASSALLTNWMRRTGWAEMFGKTRRDILVCLLQLPDASGVARRLGIHDSITLYSSATDECRLAVIMAALDRLATVRRDRPAVFPNAGHGVCVVCGPDRRRLRQRERRRGHRGQQPVGQAGWARVPDIYGLRRQP
jgi:hypothetical protein